MNSVQNTILCASRTPVWGFDLQYYRVKYCTLSVLITGQQNRTKHSAAQPGHILDGGTHKAEHISDR